MSAQPDRVIGGILGTWISGKRVIRSEPLRSQQDGDQIDDEAERGEGGEKQREHDREILMERRSGDARTGDARSGQVAKAQEAESQPGKAEQQREPDKIGHRKIAHLKMRLSQRRGQQRPRRNAFGRSCRKASTAKPGGGIKNA